MGKYVYGKKYFFFRGQFKAEAKETIFNFVRQVDFCDFFLLLLAKSLANHLHWITLRTRLNATNTLAYLPIGLSLILHAAACLRKFFFCASSFDHFHTSFFSIRNRCFLWTILWWCCCCCSTSFKFFRHFCRKSILYLAKTHTISYAEWINLFLIWQKKKSTFIQRLLSYLRWLIHRIWNMQ